MNNQRPLKKEQLYNTDAFIRFCRVDEHNTRKLGNHIIAPFLDACEKDELILPIYSEEQPFKNEKGEEGTKVVKFYSPFQIFLASAFSENIIDNEGNLRDPNLDWEPTPGHRARYIKWEQGSFNVDIYKERKHKPVLDNDRDYFGIIDDFHSFLKILHSLNDDRYSTEKRRETLRYYQSLPSLQYDLEPFKDDALLANYELNIEKLRTFLYLIGAHATRIDPLEHWYYYAKKHPQWRRDELKGMASVAQDLYGLCDILIEVIEMKTGETIPPLLEFLHSGMKPFHMKRVEYAGGTDLFAIKDVFSKMIGWMQDPLNQEILTHAAGLNEDRSIDDLNKKMERLESRITDFETKYNDRRYTEGMRLTSPETKLTVSDLDPYAQRHVEMIMRQKRENGIDEDDILRTNDPEAIALWKSGKKDEAIERYLAFQQQYEIVWAIEHSLDEIRRDVTDVCSWISRVLYDLEYVVEEKKKDAEPKAIEAFLQTQDPNHPQARGLYIQFMHTGLKVALKEYDERIEKIRTLKDNANDFMMKSRLLYCAKCRKRPVVLHQQDNDGKVSGEAICDECLEEISESVLDSTNEEWKKLSQAEWKCQCGKVLYKFAIGNIFSSATWNRVPVKYKLDYGRLHVEIKCPDCDRMHERLVDWGWLP